MKKKEILLYSKNDSNAIDIISSDSDIIVIMIDYPSSDFTGEEVRALYRGRITTHVYRNIHNGNTV